MYVNVERWGLGEGFEFRYGKREKMGAQLGKDWEGGNSSQPNSAE